MLPYLDARFSTVRSIPSNTADVWIHHDQRSLRASYVTSQDHNRAALLGRRFSQRYLRYDEFAAS